MPPDDRAAAHVARERQKLGEEPGGEETGIAARAAVAERDDRIVVTKDADFAISFRLRGRPRRLLPRVMAVIRI